MANGASSPARSGIREERRGACHVFTIDRGGALNAITADMIATLSASYPKLARDSNLYAVVLRSADPRAFSAGGDVRALTELARVDVLAAKEWLRREYQLNWLHECFSKPSIALIDGLVMGSGVGLSAYATHRVAGERYTFAMPETAIGLFPDVGTAHVLARLPHRIGVYLGLTGLSVRRADAFALGLVTHCIDGAEHDGIVAALADAQTIDPLLDGLHRDPGASELMARAKLIARCFSQATVAQVIGELQAAVGYTAGGGDQRQADRSIVDVSDADRAFAQATLDVIAKRSPLALAVTLRHIREAAVLDLRHTLQADYRLASRFLEGHEFYEGVRAALIDKDQSPRWRPAAIADITDDMLDDLFAPLPPAEELTLPLRAEMQAKRV